MISLGRTKRYKMIRKQALLFPTILFCLCAFSYAQQWSGILDPTRAVDWSQAGIPGGIPTNRTQCGSTIQASSFGNGSSDATSGIQSALNSCGSGHFVLLSAGTFRINSQIVIPSNVTLRGSGTESTILSGFSSSEGGSGLVVFGSVTSPSTGTANAITGGATQGSSSITVSGSGISVGQLLMITGNDFSYMTEAGTGGSCTWCNNGFPGDYGQTVEVTGVSGSTVNFRPPLYFNYSTQSPKAYRFNAGCVGGGLENLELYANNTGYWTMIQMQGTKYSWVEGVEDNFADNAHMEIYYSLGNEIRNSFFHDGFNHGPGGTDNQVNLALQSSANLIENNIMWRQHVSVMAEWGASGNVIAYNYMTGNYHQSQTNWMINDMDWHGAHPAYNLLEGNVGDKLELDDYWGSNSHTTVFRDYYSGSRQYVPPLNARGALQPQNAQWEDGNGSVFAYSFDSLSYYNNMVGSIAGSSHMLAVAPLGLAESPASGANGPDCIRIGYNSNENSAGSSTPVSTMFMHGVYDCIAGTFTWNSGTTHTLPASFYLQSKPSYWGSNAWPGIGPDVTGGTNGPGGYVHANPAELCFQNSPKDSNGFPQFNPVNCYGQSTGSTPPTTLAPPQDLNAVVQ
jgi:hypothetical protein